MLWLYYLYGSKKLPLREERNERKEMKIVLIEPLSVNAEVIEALSADWVKAGHSFSAYDTRAQSVAELHQRAGDADIIIEGNQPLHCTDLKNADI